MILQNSFKRQLRPILSHIWFPCHQIAITRFLTTNDNYQTEKQSINSFLTPTEKLLKRAFLLYIGIFTIGLTGWGIVSYLIDEKYSKSWPWKVKLYSKLAIINQDILKNNIDSQEFLIKCLQNVNIVEGLDEGKFKLLTLEEFKSKDKEWQTTYINMILRLAIIKFESTKDLNNSKKLLLYAVNLPIDVGDIELKSKGLRYIAQLSIKEGKLKNAERYLLDTLRYNELYKDDIKFIANGSNLLALNSSYDVEIVEVLIELGKLYAIQHKTESLEIFLNLLENFQNNESFRIDKAMIPLLRVYIGEVLYSQDLVQKAMYWNQQAFNDLIDNHHNNNNNEKSFQTPKKATKNLIRIHTDLKNEDEVSKFKSINEQLKK